jgi:asparagine synthetase B (glutamine-hydrolysing)
MCGIYGIISQGVLGDIAFNRDQLVHRGPDDAGIMQNSLMKRWR